jgi:hypothetical protein
LLGMIGEQFDLVPSGEVLGLVLSLKFNNDQISIWHRKCDPDTVNKIKICIEKILGNNAFKGSSAFNKKSAKGADLISCIESGTVQLTHEIFSALMQQSKEPHEVRQFDRAAFRGRGSRGGYRGHTESHEESKNEEDDGFQTVFAQKK